MDGVELAREYYRAIDEADYEALDEMIAADFRQKRADRTLEGRTAFVRFMREERPVTDTTHELAAVFVRDDGVAVEGRLLRPDGSRWFGFVDVFDVESGRLTELRTYTR